MTALMGACKGGHLSVVEELLKNRGAYVNAKDNVRYHIQIRFMIYQCELSPYSYGSC